MRVYASAGVARVPSGIHIDRADQALYIAKGTGKNRVVSENELVSAISVDEIGKFAL